MTTAGRGAARRGASNGADIYICLSLQAVMPPYRAISEATASHWHTRHGLQHASAAVGAEGGTESQRPDGSPPALSSANGSNGPHRGSGAAASTAGAGNEGDSGDWAQKGRWDYVVGLVGKPSAGKSTFYNAVVDPLSEAEGARVAAFPVRVMTDEGWGGGGGLRAVEGG